MDTIESNQLKHHGILGMKWGVRRFQNKDGSLTAAGKRRLNKGGDDDSDGTKASAGKKEKSSSKSLSELSDAELRERIARLELEKRYRDLSESPKEVSKGKEFITKTVLPKFGNTLVNVANDYASKKLKEALGLNDSDPMKDLKKKVEKLDLEKRYKNLTDKDAKKDDELRKKIEALELEKRYKNLTDEDAKKDDELRKKVQRLVLEEQYDKYKKKKKEEEEED